VGRGTGLGLSTVYGIVKQHGGNISVYSEPGRGTTFRIYFPRINSVCDDVCIQEAAAEISQGVETILVVEDNTQVRDLACEILGMYGYKVIDTPDGRSAIEAASSYDGVIHLLITDMVMPDMNGRELYEQIAKIHTGIKSIFMSGYSADIISHHGVLESGMAFIQKPFSIQDFMVKVREVLDAKQA
jgi:two-component system, cell cycle sensor histidine kinase and response regulator CckA